MGMSRRPSACSRPALSLVQSDGVRPDEQAAILIMNRPGFRSSGFDSCRADTYRPRSVWPAGGLLARRVNSGQAETRLL